MKKDEALKLIETLPDEEIIVRTSSQEQEFLTNFKEAEVEKAIKPHIGNLHAQYEADFEPILGKKPEGAKTYAWIKEEGAKLKQAADKLSQAETKLVELETQLKSGKLDEAATKKIEDLTKEVSRLEKLHKSAKQEWEQGLEKERSEFRSLRIKSELNHSMMGFKFLPKEIIADEVREPFVNQVLNDLVRIADFDDTGKLIFKDTEGNLMRNKEAAVVTPAELLSAKLKPILDNGKQQPGLGGENGGKGKGNEPQTSIVVPAHIGTITELTAYLRMNYPNIKPQSEEYKVAYAKYSKDLKIA